MPSHIAKIARRIVQAQLDEITSPVHTAPTIGMTIQDLRILHELPQGFTTHSFTALETIQVKFINLT